MGSQHSEKDRLNFTYIEQLYDEYKQAPERVDPSWQQFFKGYELGSGYYQGDEATQEGCADSRAWQIDALRRAYQRYGHLIAKTHPYEEERPSTPLLPLAVAKLTDSDLNTLFPTLGLLLEDLAPLSSIVERLNELYAHRVGYEFHHIDHIELKTWLYEQVERSPEELKPAELIHFCEELHRAELFEQFIHANYMGEKRFSLEGAEILIPLLGDLFDRAIDAGVETCVMGMAHRGRLNVLANLMNKPYSKLFHEFEPSYCPRSSGTSGNLTTGDVRYHQGFSTSRRLGEKEMKMVLQYNPSHLEAVNGVTLGAARGRSQQDARDKTLPILIHGDAAFAGQGVVYETLQMAHIEGYEVDGTIHCILNNQIGFTAEPSESRSTRYCTDLGKAFSIPIFHVNGNDPTSVIRSLRLAFQARQKFGCDVILDINCYRKYGHNETDEPAYTQPKRAKKIKQLISPPNLFQESLMEQGILEKSDIESFCARYLQTLQNALDEAKRFVEDAEKYQSMDVASDEDLFAVAKTQVTNEHICSTIERITTVPEGFNLHSRLKKILNDRRLLLDKGQDEPLLDWALCELIAYSTLLDNNTPIRLTGQDSLRGTFSHRHAALVDQQEGTRYIPMNQSPSEAKLSVYNSPLSEYGALAFELGYSLACPKHLTVWEAQFGDFANGAQIIIDQFLSSMEAKWGKVTNLTLLLPHGYEGMGPEHSSARLERFLQLSAEGNWRICSPSRPSQLFHLLRRQILSAQKKPLIVFMPKSLLRAKQSFSAMNELTDQTFWEFYDDPNPAPSTQTLILCTGKIFYALDEKRREEGIENHSIVRIEQLYPLNLSKFRELLQRYTHIKKVVWAQEEPQNMGAFEYIRPYLKEIYNKTKVKVVYAGLPRLSSTAHGSAAMHRKEYAKILSKAFGEESQ